MILAINFSGGSLFYFSMFFLVLAVGVKGGFLGSDYDASWFDVDFEDSLEEGEDE